MSTETTLSEEAHDAAYDLALVLADTKFLTAHRYSEWGMLGAPDIEEDIALSSVIQDELGHARAGYKAAADAGDTSIDDLLYERSADEWRSPVVLDMQFKNWADIIASLGIFDYATMLLYENVDGGSFGPLQTMAGKVLQEESQHVQHGQAWFSVFADESQDEFEKADLQSSIDRFVPAVAQWLGRDEGSAPLVEADVLSRGNEAMREEFLGDIGQIVDGNGFGMPTVSLDWSGWDDATRRPTVPDSKAFEETVNDATGRKHRYLAGK